MTLTDTSVVTLTPGTGSVHPPLVSGAELMAKFPQLVPPTNADDGESPVLAISGLIQEMWIFEFVKWLLC